MPIDDYFIFNGQKSSDFGLMIASDPHAIHPARRGGTYPVPGRNGVIVREDGSYETYTQVYDVLIDSNSDGIYERAHKIADWLLGSRGFCRLEDSFEPLYFRSARCAAQLDIENRLTRFGRAQIAFECQPQRFLKSGESSVSFDFEGDGINTASVFVTPVPRNATKAKMTVAVQEGAVVDGARYWMIASNESETIIHSDPFSVVSDPEDFEYTNVMNTSSSRYIAGAHWDANSQSFVDSENPECDCVVIPVPANNEAVRIRIKNATFSTWSTTYGGSSNSSFTTAYGRHEVGSSTPTDENGDIYFDFQNNGSSFITFNIDPMSNPSSLIVTVNEPIIKINADGMDIYESNLLIPQDSNDWSINAFATPFYTSDYTTVTVYDSVEHEICECVLGQWGEFSIINPTDHESRPLIKVTGIPSSPPSPVTQTLTMRDGIYISRGGTILRATSPEGMVYDKVSSPVNVSGYAYAYITGSGYVFLDSNGKTRSGSFVPSVSGNVQNRKVIIPAWAAKICVATSKAKRNASLQFLTAYNAGAAVATVNGTTINLDFSVHDTIYLDCDLHDAYYEDGSSANAAVSFSSTITDHPTFPGLIPGDNTISVSYENTVSFEIVPRWWVL